MGWGQGYESISDVNSRLEREGRQEQRQGLQNLQIIDDLKIKLENISKEKKQFLDEIKNDPSNIENYETDMNEYGIILNTYNDIYSTTYENDLNRINQTKNINYNLNLYFSKILDDTYQSQYKEYSKKNKMIHILIIFIIIGIIVLIVTHIKDISDYWLFLFVPIILIVGYISYTWFKRILEKKYTEKQNKREHIKNTITNKYKEYNNNTFTNSEEESIRTIIENTKTTIGT